MALGCSALLGVLNLVTPASLGELLDMSRALNKNVVPQYR